MSLNWRPVNNPLPDLLDGMDVQLERLAIKTHGQALFELYAHHENAFDWQYLPYGPFSKPDDFNAFLEQTCLDQDPWFFTVRLKGTDQVAGMLSYLNIAKAHGSIEIGHIHFSRILQRTKAATETLYLLMNHAFEMGYRRLEWKCNNDNERSKRSALRLGYQFEGVFRQHMVVKDQNRDTAWYSIIDQEWPELKQAFERWLEVKNFDVSGQQKASLLDFMRHEEKFK